MPNLESSSSIRGNVEIWKLNKVKEFLHMLRLQNVPIEVKQIVNLTKRITFTSSNSALELTYALMETKSILVSDCIYEWPIWSSH